MTEFTLLCTEPPKVRPDIERTYIRTPNHNKGVHTVHFAEEMEEHFLMVAGACRVGNHLAFMAWNFGINKSGRDGTIEMNEDRGSFTAITTPEHG